MFFLSFLVQGLLCFLSTTLELFFPGYFLFYFAIENLAITQLGFFFNELLKPVLTVRGLNFVAGVKNLVRGRAWACL